MKIIKTLTFTLLFAAAVVNSSIYGNNRSLVLKIDDTPSKTICIKNPAASNTTEFFSKTTQFSFEIFKAGSKDDVLKIIKPISKVESIEVIKDETVKGELVVENETKKDEIIFPVVEANDDSNNDNILALSDPGSIVI